MVARSCDVIGNCANRRKVEIKAACDEDELEELSLSVREIRALSHQYHVGGYLQHSSSAMLR